MKQKQKQILSAVICCGCVEINVSTKKLPNTKMICDLADFDRWRLEPSYGRIFAFQSREHTYPYASFTVNSDAKRRKMLFHRFVRPDIGIIDHDNRIGLDNRRSNLRDGSGCVNEWNQKTPSTNTSGQKGVCWRKEKCKWDARISVLGKKKFLGYFGTFGEAVVAYEAAYKKYEKLVSERAAA